MLRGTVLPALVLLCGVAFAAGVDAAFEHGGGAQSARPSVSPETAQVLFEQVGQLIEQVGELRGEVDSLRAGKLRSDERLATLEIELTALAKEQNTTTFTQQAERRRRTQAQDAPVGENVKIIKPQVARCGTSGSTTTNGIVDPMMCADRAFARCHPEECEVHGGGHRRAQSAAASCDANELSWRTDGITTACCDDPGEDCSGGYPHTCNPDCARLFLSFWDECHSQLGEDSQHYEPVVALCEAAVNLVPSIAEQLNVECTDGTPATECIPECSESLHGFLMLLNIEGDDAKLACELHKGLYSWVGSSVRAQMHPSFCSAPVLR